MRATVVAILAALSLGAVTSTSSRTDATGNGSTAAFTFTWPVYEASSVEVLLDSVQQLSGYTVALNANQDTSPGGTVTFSTAPATGVAVRLQRTVPLTQTTTFAPYSAFNSKTMNRTLDRLTMEVQQVDRTHADDKTAQATKDAAQDATASGIRSDLTAETSARSTKDAAQDAALDAAILGAASLPTPLPESQGGTGAATLGQGTVTATGGTTARSLAAWLSAEEVIRPSGDATGATDVANINAATAAGKAVRLVSGVYYLNATLPLGDATTKRGYVIRGAPPQLASNWASVTSGTEFRAVGTGFAAMEYAPTTYIAQPTGDQAHQQHLQGVDVENIAFTGFAYAIHGGRTYNASFMHSTFRNLYSLGATSWAFWFENFQEDVFEKIVAFPAPTATGAMMFAASFLNFTDGNSLFLHIFGQASGGPQHGIVFKAYNGDTSGVVALNDVNAFDIQYNGGGPAASATATSAGGTALTLSGYSVGASIASCPVDSMVSPDAAALGLVPYRSYFVASNNGVDTITLADYQGGPAKTIPAGSVLAHCNGFAPIEIVGYGDYGYIQPSTFHGADAESSGGAGILFQKGVFDANLGTVTYGQSLTGVFAGIVLRTTLGVIRPFNLYSLDIDNNSANKTLVIGGGAATDSAPASTVFPQGVAPGLRLDRGTSTYVLNLGPTAGAIEAVNPALRVNGSGFTVRNYDGSSTYATFDTGGNLTLSGGMQPGPPNHGTQTGRIYMGSGAPQVGYAGNGDFYLRTDTPGTSNQRLYIMSGGAWVGIL